ncbi:bifunctional phosphopantothenoylcysteine decarboxylase/phosphopantothenate--cysteine ligase CoaBC [Clostridium aminobutyricum]|uniref:Coenzyme A biosynthesis bifunctional protein CoaBC n=1 Tax=Clostridium aminobutyricum TaxID=33953 RepID=A0A939IJ10_CLOAM|nr:bifunctional phosphopantothenoylcysteine decarboxylase/phosphopantothenate--cysteine ligase CoaBC [Clostridium aminobutyricum]MBN7773084.1 bifunctional phosphopantothenoylcysteine decarboxylase/phosphopantothenate--cysteine ligase CoaBC [Clostridium aminobutyricum]
MLSGKCVVLGVTGSIAAYKIAYLASALKKQNCDVHVIMTKNATEFIAPLTFETLTGNKCLVDTFDRDFQFDVTHISIAKKADLILVAPASANVIAKMANGIADDMLTTTVLASKAVKLVSPAMNTNMYQNPITQDNLKKLEGYGFEVIQPATGLLACNDVGEGKMPEPEVLFEYVLKHIAMEKDLLGKKVIVTAGPTQEAIDPVRYITNHSTGKMGYALAKACMLRGAEVTLVSGQTSIVPPMFVHVIPIRSAKEMFDAVSANCESADMIFKAAAVADYTPSVTHDNKVKKKEGDMAIPLKRTEDILQHVGSIKRSHQLVCGFSMETENMLENSTAKLEKKKVDMIVANNLKVAGAGFGVETNIVTLITKNGTKELPMMSKFDTANEVINHLMTLGQ